MDHIHLLVSTFDTSNVAVAHNLRSCSRCTLRDQDQGGQDHDQDQQGRDQDLKKVVLIGLETKTRSRDPHPCPAESPSTDPTHRYWADGRPLYDTSEVLKR